MDDLLLLIRVIASGCNVSFILEVIYYEIFINYFLTQF